MKQYSKYEDILEAIQLHLRQCRRQGEPLLAGERQLAQDFDASRGTIRKVLAELEATGQILRDQVGTRILPAKKQKHRYGFITTVHHDNGSFWFDFYHRVWQQLARLAGEAGITVELLDCDPEDPAEPPEAFLRRLDGVDLLFHSITRPPVCHVLPGLSRPVVYLNIDGRPESAPLIAIDDAEVGRAAARLLLEAGCRKAAAVAVCVVAGNIPFRLRAESFTAEMAAAGATAEIHAGPGNDLAAQISAMSDYVNGLAVRGFDGLFFLSDEYCDFIASKLFSEGLVPGNVSVVAFDGSSTARVHHPPITTISHGSREMAEEILRTIIRFETSGIRSLPAGTRLITPRVYPGRTLRKSVANAI